MGLEFVINSIESNQFYLLSLGKKKAHDKGRLRQKAAQQILDEGPSLHAVRNSISTCTKITEIKKVEWN